MVEQRVMPPVPRPPEHIEVRKVAYNCVRARVGTTEITLTRLEAFRLIGMLERAAGEA